MMIPPAYPRQLKRGVALNRTNVLGNGLVDQRVETRNAHDPQHFGDLLGRRPDVATAWTTPIRTGVAPHLNSFELGQYGRYRTNVWEYRGVNTLKSGRLEELALHPTVKPVAMIVDAIKDVSCRGGIVLDLFGGSGSSLIAAHKTGRRARVL